MIPLEAARLGLPAFALDYSWVAVLASRLLADYAHRNWDDEPPLPLGRLIRLAHRRTTAAVQGCHRVHSRSRHPTRAGDERLLSGGGGPSTLGLCVGAHDPLQGGTKIPAHRSPHLRKASTKKTRNGSPLVDEGQSFIELTGLGLWSILVQEGPPVGMPTRQTPSGKSRYDSGGKLAVCPFCGFGHDRSALMELLGDGKGADAILLAADLDPSVGKHYRG